MRLVALFLTAFAINAYAETNLLPPQAENGQCFEQEFTEPTITDGSTTIVTKSSYRDYT